MNFEDMICVYESKLLEEYGLSLEAQVHPLLIVLIV